MLKADRAGSAFFDENNKFAVPMCLEKMLTFKKRIKSRGELVD